MNRTSADPILLTILLGLVFTAASGVRVDAAQPIDFDTQVVPILTRFGCNTGACHGAAAGRGGLQLSLFGSDAAADHAAIAWQLEGRRVDIASPADSLLLRKATEIVEHGGGERFTDEHAAYRILSQWIGEGARRRLTRTLVRFDLTPTQRQLESVGDHAEVRAVATFSDGERVDVTDWTVLTSADTGALEVAETPSRLIVRRRGEHVAVARYLDQVRPIRVSVPLGDRPVEFAELDDDQWIDRHIHSQLERLRIPASPACDDHEFVRRVYLDLAGRLPTPDEVETFVDQSGGDRRAALIDSLLASREFADTWGLKWANVMRIDRGQLDAEGAEAFHRWIAARLRADAPWDESVEKMVTATGDSYSYGPANFLRIGGGAAGSAEYLTESLMGVRLRCANCHNHPLDHWQQDDYHGLAAIFAKVRRGQLVSFGERGEVTHPVTGQPAIPRIPADRYLDAEGDHRPALAEWLTDAENPYLARATVNRVWRALMGRGLIEPVDDLRDTNPASHPALLDEMANRFFAGGYRFQPLIRDICRSEAYQRTSHPVPGNETDAAYYSRFFPRPLEAEIAADAIADVTGVPMRFGDSDVTRAVLLTDNRVPSIGLDLLGRCDRTMSCDSGTAAAGSLSRVLHFLNGELLNRPLTSPACVLTELLQDEPDDRRVADQLYLRVFSRPMTDAEAEYWLGQRSGDAEFASESGRRAFFEDLLWSLLTSDSFLMNR